MSKKAKISLCVGCAILICILFFAYAQRNTILALMDSARYTQDELLQNMEESKKKIQQYIDENEDIVVRDLTEEEWKAFSEGLLTEEEVINIITGKNQQSAEEAPPDADDETVKQAADQAVSKAIAKLYVQKGNYLGRLSGIEAEARQAYNNMSPEEKKGAKQRLLSQCLSRAASLEAECDAAVNAILAEIRTAVEVAGQDTSIVNELKQAYLAEKRSQKAYYMGKYMN